MFEFPLPDVRVCGGWQIGGKLGQGIWIKKIIHKMPQDFSGSPAIDLLGSLTPEHNPVIQVIHKKGIRGHVD